jgi:tetratricopeptide (TPR) repeat protein
MDLKGEKMGIKTVQLIILFSIILSGSAFASVSKDELKDRKASLTSEGTHRRLSRAHELLSKDKLGEAIDVLERLLSSTEKRPHEKAQVLQNLGFAYAQKENYKKALQYLQASLDLNVLPYSPTLSTLYTIAQVNVAQENYDLALKQIEEWFKLADEPSADAYVLKATIFAQKKKSKEALALVTKAIDMTTEPKESWLSFAVAMNYELENYKESARLLEKLAAFYPEKKKYWKQLAGVYLNLEKNPQALATMELAHKGNYLDKDAEIMNLVSLFIFGGIPLKGAQLLDESMASGAVKKTQKNYEILGDAWQQAEEMDKALKAYAQSATMATDGRIFAKQGRIYLEQEKWGEADKYLSQGLQKGHIKNPQHVHIALGVARFNLKKFDEATKSFEEAKKASDKVTAQANQWIGYVKAEDKRLHPEKYKAEVSPVDEDDSQETL